jgi:hypothetical protein
VGGMDLFLNGTAIFADGEPDLRILVGYTPY